MEDASLHQDNLPEVWQQEESHRSWSCQCNHVETSISLHAKPNSKCSRCSSHFEFHFLLFSAKHILTDLTYPKGLGVAEMELQSRTLANIEQPVFICK